MFKKLLSLFACVLLATGALLAPAQAQAANYYFYSICVVSGGCPGGPGPVLFGPFTTLAQCNSAHALTANTFWGLYPRSLSTCFLQ